MTRAQELKDTYGYDYERRWDAVIERTRESDADAFVITGQGNLRYLCCAHIPFNPVVTSIVLTADGAIAAITSSLEEFRAREECAVEDIRVFTTYRGIEAFAPGSGEALKKLLDELGARKILYDSDPGLDGVEGRADDFVQTMRMKKDDAEIKAMRVAAEIAVETEREIRERILKPGRSEVEVAADIDYTIRSLGAQINSFETIVASGPHSAYSHHNSTHRIIREGESVICDFGAYYNGYASDVTRTYFTGGISGELKELFELVSSAQDMAIKAAAVGKKYSELDTLARDLFAENGKERYFVHSLGHGLGLDVHELPLGIKADTREVIDTGNVFTVEPGLYVPGVGGVRIEDDILVTDDGIQNLTRRY